MLEVVNLVIDLGYRIISLFILVILILFNIVALISYILYESSIKIINKLKK